ncbi:Toll-like receptor 9 [Mortierella antarctica]|nr:Toll-like receptor 9 [Mortierella antarctica]
MLTCTSTLRDLHKYPFHYNYVLASSTITVSNQTGIKVSSKLSGIWKDATAGSTVRAIKVSIVNEALEEDGIFNIKGTFEQDYGTVHDNLTEKQPAYFLVRMDERSDWLFLCFVPDVAPIRQKMIYAATRASLTKDLGDSHFKDSIYGTHLTDFTWDGYKKHRASLAAPKPLTDRERQLAEIAANEKIMIENMKGASLRKSHAPGMNFPLTDRAVDALKKLVVAKPAPKPVVVASALPKKFSSPASTPLPASPVISSEEPKKDDSAKTVDDDEWDDDEEKDKEEKKEDKEEEKVEEKEEQAEVPAEEPVVEEEPEVPVKVERTVNFVKLAIDVENEKIDLVTESKITANQVHRNIDGDAPRFTFFAYEHTHSGTEHDTLVFMYTCPSKSKIRERMLYSSCRAGVLEAAKVEADLTVDKKLETTDVEDLTEDYLLEELYPKSHAVNSPYSNSGAGAGRGFSKPARPGARRVM